LREKPAAFFFFQYALNVRVLAFAAVCALSSCSLFVGLDGLDDGSGTNDGDASGLLDGTAQDGSGGDAKTGDAQIGDAGADAGECPFGAIFCDDFETGNFSRWETANPPALPNVLEVSSAKSWRGKYAMHVSVSDPADSGNTFYVNAHQGFGALSSGTFALRAYVYVPAGSTYGAFFVLTHDTSQTETVIFGPETCTNSTTTCLYSATVGSGVDIAANATVALPTDQWNCVEWVVELGDAGGVAGYVGGGLVFQASGDTADPAGGFSAIDVGFMGALGGESVYIDDLAVSTQRLGCE
jgi:hypothetical protein